MICALRVACSAPDRSQPRLLCARQSRRPIVVLDFGKSRCGQVASPGFETVIHAEATAAPTFLIIAARIGAEQHALGLERDAQFPQYARELLCGNMKQRGVREDAVEIIVGEVEL